MNKEKLDAALSAAGTKRFDAYYMNAKEDAQRNLCGRTHYVDSATLKFHKARVISAHLSSDCLLFAIVETCAADWENRTRICRSVVFDVFGEVIERKEWPTPRAAGAHLGTFLPNFPTHSHTISLLHKQVNKRLKDAASILECLNSIEKEEA